MIRTQFALNAVLVAAALSVFPAASHAQDEQKLIPAQSMGGAPAAKAAEAPKTAITGEGTAEADLTLDVTKFDFAGTKAANRMYIPCGVPLKAEKPATVTKEPAYSGKVSYATIQIGNGSPNQFAVAVDEPSDKDAKIYLDLNGDGDLTNDGTGEWPTKGEAKADGPASYQGTFIFTPGWRTADGGNTSGQYALNLYWQGGRTLINYYAASARVGKVSIDGKDYDVTLIESDGDGIFNKLHDPTRPVIAGEKMSKPVYLLLDGNQYDIRGTFPFGGMNYLAKVTDDGSRIALAPTMRVVQPPRPQQDKLITLSVGAEAPDFEALAWSSGQNKVDTANRFKLSDYRGKKIVVLDMWATWCGPCMKGIPHLSKVAEAVAGQDVEVIALNVSDDEAPFEKFAAGKGAEYKFKLARDPAGRDPNGNTIARKLYGVTGIPATFVIDKTGKIVGTVSGYTEGDTQLEQILKGLGVKLD